MEQSLRAELARAREEADRLFDSIAPEALYERPIPERHRLIFYLGHFDAFDWNLLARRSRGEKSFHPEFDRLFERGIDPGPGEAMPDSPRDWPSRKEVESYNSRTREWIDAHLNELDPRLLRMAVEHRYMHAETFAYLMHNLPNDQKRCERAVPREPAREAPSNPMLEIEAGAASLGTAAEDFGWDNERRAHRAFTPAFRISKFKISNGEYLAFVREGGPVPHFWVKRADEWLYRGMFEITPLPLNAPVWVTWRQAQAFAAWRGLDLPSEPQWQRASSQVHPSAARDNFGFVGWDPVAVDAGFEAANGGAPVQMVGNGWEWTRDAFAPFEGFEPDPLYPGYSADFFDGRHYVMKGASPRTAPLLTRSGFRNWFRPEYPYMYAGFRLVEN